MLRQLIIIRVLQLYYYYYFFFFIKKAWSVIWKRLSMNRTYNNGVRYESRTLVDFYLAERIRMEMASSRRLSANQIFVGR